MGGRWQWPGRASANWRGGGDCRGASEKVRLFTPTGISLPETRQSIVWTLYFSSAINAIACHFSQNFPSSVSYMRSSKPSQKRRCLSFEYFRLMASRTCHQHRRTSDLSKTARIAPIWAKSLSVMTNLGSTDGFAARNFRK